jgi:CheY-like chemotaxis protein
MVPLIGVTAMAGPEERRRCLEAGMDAHLSKPLSRSKLLRTLADLMATHAWLRNDDPGPGRPSASIPLS